MGRLALFLTFVCGALCVPYASYAIDYTTPTNDPSISLLVANNNTWASAGDLNGDGHDDLAVVGPLGSLAVHLYDGPENFSREDFLVLPAGQTFACLDVADGDFSGYGRILTVIQGNFIKPKLQVFDVAGATLDILYEEEFGAVGQVITNCEFVPLRGTGYLDIIVTSPSFAGGFRGFLFNGPAELWNEPLSGVGAALSDPFGIAAGDFVGDGIRSLVISDRTAGVSREFAFNPNTFTVATLGSIMGGGLLRTYHMNGKDHIIAFPLADNMVHFQKTTMGWTTNTLGWSSYLNGWVGQLDNNPNTIEIVFGENEAYGVLTYSGSGSGSQFGSVSSFTNADATDVVVLDVNGDGQKDFAGIFGLFEWYYRVATCTSTTCLPGTYCDVAAGCVSHPPVSETIRFPYTVNDAVFAPVNGNLGETDLVTVGNTPYANVRVYKRSGGFFQDDPVWQSSTLNGSRANAVAVGDCNNNGRLDIFAGLSINNVPSFAVIQNLGGANFNVLSTQSLSGMGNVTDIALGDVDGDGKLDLAVIQENGPVQVYRGEGGCTFSSLPKYEGTTDFRQGKLLFTDLNNDINPELVVVGRPLSGSNGIHEIHHSFSFATWSYTSNSVSIPNRAYLDVVSYVSGINFRLLMATAEQEVWAYQGFPVFGTSFTLTDESTALALGEFGQFGLGAVFGRSGGFEIIPELGGPTIFRFLPSGLTPAILRTGRLRDKEPVHAASFSYTGTTTTLEIDKQATLFTATAFSPSGFNFPVTDLTFADLDNNGFKDLIVAASDTATPGPKAGVFYNLGAGFGPFEGFPGSALAIPTSGVAAGDLTGNGRLDVFVNGNTLTKPTIIESTSGGLSDRHLSLLPNGGGKVVLHDLNLDGRLDIVRESNAALNRLEYSLDGGATWVLLVNDSAKSIQVGDFTGNGYPDIVALTLDSISQHRVRIFQNDGDGTFTSTAAVVPTKAALFLSDVNQDGKRDIVLVENTSPVTAQVWRNTGGGSFSADPPKTFGTPFVGLFRYTMGDVTNNGRDELVIMRWKSLLGARFDVYDFQSGQVVGGGAFPTLIGASAHSVELVDLDNDGDLDVMLTVNNNTSKFALFRNNLISSPATTNSSWQTSNTSTTATLGRPNLPFAYADGGGGRPILGDFVDIPITFFDRESDPVKVDLEWRLNRAGTWKPMKTIPSPLGFFKSSRTGVSHTIRWDLASDRGVHGNIDGTDVEVRAWVQQTPSRSTFPIWTPAFSVVGPPMMVIEPGCAPACDATEVCLFGSCFTDCSVSLCPAGSTCYEGTCFEADPCDTTNGVQCPAGTVCEQGGCFTACEDSGDCTPPFLCFDGACQDPQDLCAGLLCPSGTTCFVGACVPDNVCSSDLDCPAGESCYASGCADICDLVNCPLGFACIQGMCLQDCSDSDDCSPPNVCYDFGCALPNDPCGGLNCPLNTTCFQGECVPSCVDDTDCSPPLSTCYDGTFCGAADPCDLVNCPTGMACEQGGCFAACGSDDDCSPPFVCFDNLCRNSADPCDAVSCPSNQACYLGSCFPTCDDSGDCNPPYSFCFDSSVCLNAGDLCDGVICGGGQACHQGQCLESCSDTDPCANPNICYTEYCAPPGGPCDVVTCPDGMDCYQGGCYLSCTSSDECAVSNECFYDSGMTNPERCVTDACDNVFCPLGERCFGGVCYAACNPDGTCDDPNSICYNNDLCMPVDLCDSVYCALGNTCESGSCFEACQANADCPGYVGFGANFTNVANTVNLATPWDKFAGSSFGDINNDGCLDLALNTSSASGMSRLYTSDCAASPVFTDATSTLVPHFLAFARERSLIWGDWNNDGNLDLARNTTNVVNVYRNTGAPDYRLEMHKAISVSGMNAEGMGWIDYNGDGFLDLVFENSGGSIEMFRNDTMGDFVRVTGIGLDAGDITGDFCTVGDINADGHVDLICRKDGTSKRDLYYNRGDGTFSSSNAFNQNANNSNKGGVSLCDVNNDGLFDIIWTDNGPNQIWIQNPVGVFTATNEPAASSGFALPSTRMNDVLCGDINHDGKLDLFWVGQSGSYLFINQSTSSTLAFERRNFGINSTSYGLSGAMADFNRDGSLDILVHANVRNELWRNPRQDNRYLMIRALMDLGSGKVRDGIGATVHVRNADGEVIGLREVNGGRGRGSQDPAIMHYGLPYGADVPYHLTVTWPHGRVVQKCVVPSSITGYQLVEIKDSDADDMMACFSVGNWREQIVTASQEGDFCYNGRCAADSCEGVICPKGSTCYGGNCRAECPPACALGLTCIDGACVAGLCDAGNFECPVNFACANGECAPECARDSDCSSGQFCYQGACVVEDCTGVVCPSGQSCFEGICFGDCASSADCGDGMNCYDGRCASDGCAALDTKFDENFIYRETKGHVSATRESLPWFWPRPFVGSAGVNFQKWAGERGSAVVQPDVPSAKTARVSLYLDRTAANADNPEGRYVLWLNQGEATASQQPAQAAYRIQFDRASPNTPFDDDGESVQILDSDISNHRVAHAYVTNGAGETAGVAFGRLASNASRRWTIRIDASFTGDIRRWEWVNGDGSVITLDPAETLVLSLSEVGQKVYAVETGKPCDTSALGICKRGTSYCEIGELRCQQTVLPWMFEICDGRDNTCDGQVDEISRMRFPGVEWRDDSSSWQMLLTLDKATSVQDAMNFTPAGADDRVGSTDIQSTDGTGSIQEWNRAVLSMHRDMRNGALSLQVANGKQTTGSQVDVGHYDVRTRLRFTGSHTIDELFPAWWDDRRNASTDDEIPSTFDTDRMNLSWEMRQDGSGATARREADSGAFMTRWSGARASLSELEMRYQWRSDSNTSTNPKLLNFGVYRPNQGFRSIPRTRSAHFRVTPVTREESACLASGSTAAGCELSYYTCNVGGVLGCSAPLDEACDRCVDADGDGYFGFDAATCPEGRDCNDDDPEIHPGASERCNGYDDDCDGLIDIKNDAEFKEVWGEDPPVGNSCPVGQDECGPAECQFLNVCVCPDGPEDPSNPPARSCYCGEGLTQ